MNLLERVKDMLFAMERGERNLKLDRRILEEELVQGKPSRGWDMIPNTVDETLLEPGVQRQIVADLMRLCEVQQAELEALRVLRAVHAPGALDAGEVVLHGEFRLEQNTGGG